MVRVCQAIRNRVEVGLKAHRKINNFSFNPYSAKLLLTDQVRYLIALNLS